MPFRALSTRLYTSLPNKKFPAALSVNNPVNRFSRLFRVTSPFSSCSRSHRCSKKSAPIFIRANTAVCATWLPAARRSCFPARCSSALVSSVSPSSNRAFWAL